jgi:3'-phosphoadenosine 5'-phosphosulfate sulfotransferase (PAPS reductase)/FAD synthetase
MFNISYNKWLKEFIIKNPPPFRISNNCCTYAKKKPVYKLLKESNADMNVYGVRRAEGGIRAAAYQSCFTKSLKGWDQYRPIFFMTDDDKKEYEKQFGITHSACYTKYGLKRTGCVGCPYGRSVMNELESIKMFEPKLYKACMKIFGVSYEYTKQYRQFCAQMNFKEKSNPDQLTMDDLYYDFAP